MSAATQKNGDEALLFRSLPRTNLVVRLAGELAEAGREILDSPASYASAAFLPDRIGDWSPRGDEARLFESLPRTNMLARLARELVEAGREIVDGPASYLKAAFLPDRIGDWFPIRVASGVFLSAAHPIEFLAGATATDDIGLRRRRKFIPVLIVSGLVHGTLIVYLVYLMFFSAFAGIRVVNRAYRKYESSTDKLYYPTQIIQQHQLENLMKLEEIRERDRKRREEAARRQQEKEERERKAKEEAERKAKEEVAKAEEAKSKSGKDTVGVFDKEINVAPIKDMAGKIYELYKAGGLGLNDLNFSMTGKFKIMPDGSLSDIGIIQSSGSALVDDKAKELLWMIGESKALGPLNNLTSGSIRLELTNDLARLTITAFAPTADDAKAKADLLNLLFFAMRFNKNNSRDVAELLSMMKVRSENKRLDAALTVPRERANEMFKNKFSGSPPQ